MKFNQEFAKQLNSPTSPGNDGDLLSQAHHAEFVELGSWLEDALAELEIKYGDFVTRESLQRHFGKNRR